MNFKFDKIDDVIESVKRGELVIVMDSKYREYEGDFIGSGAKVTSKTINFMLSYARGAFIAALMSHERCEKLEIPPMNVVNNSLNQTKFRVSVDTKSGASGSSAMDRAKTINLLAEPGTKPENFVKPGHIVPIVAHPQGLLARKGHTEAGVELVRLAGFDPPVAIDLEILNEDGTMAHEERLFYLAQKFELKIIDIDSIFRFLTSNKSDNS